MPFQNPFSNPAFNAAAMSEAISLMPNRYGRLQQINLFPVRGSATTTVTIQNKNGVLVLLSTKERGGAANLMGRSGREVRTFEIPHIPVEDHLSPQDIQNLLAFGSDQLQTMAQAVNDRQEELRSSLDQTLEFHRMGALKGTILDADGSSVVYNLYTEFGITAKSVDFVLGTAGTKVSDKCREVVRHIEDNLKGEISTGVRALVSQEFYDKLITHANVEKAYANWAAAQERIGGDLRSGFTFGGITFEEYRAKTNNGTEDVRYIAASEGHAFPEGTSQTFRTIAGPADFNEAVNQLGQLYYSKIAETKFGRGFDLHAQMNPLAMCMRPGVLVKCHTSN